MKKKHYKDFIGENITLVFSTPMEIMQKGYPWDLLRKELYNRLKKDLRWTNGLLSDFDCVVSKIEDNQIIISGRVIKCEVDC